LSGDVFEGPVAPVSPEDIRAAIVGIVKRNGLGEGTGACCGKGRIIAAEVDVEETVLVEVGGAHRKTLTFGADSEGDVKVALSVQILHEEDFEILRDDEVLITIVVEIDEDGGGAVVHPVGFGFGGKVGEGAVGILEEEKIGKAALLAEVEIFESVAIDVAKR
jgi:hypothetical protein